MRITKSIPVMIAVIWFVKESIALATHAPKDFEWLEDSTSKATKDWVAAENKRSMAIIEASPFFRESKKDVSEILDSKEKLEYPAMFGNKILNFWKDEAHKRGILRMARKPDYLGGHPKWETLLDIDALAAEEKKLLVYKGTVCVRPKYERCLIDLSEGGSDLAETREFDITKKQFVTDGFRIPAGRNTTVWLDQDTILLSSAVKKEDQNQAGYPKVIRLLHRKEAIDKSKVVFSGADTDVRALGYTIYDGDTQYVMFGRRINFSQQENYLSTPDGPVKIPLPESTWIRGIQAKQVIVMVDTKFKGYPAGSIFSFPLTDLKNPESHFELIYSPQPNQEISTVSVIKGSVYTIVQEDVKSKLYQAAYDKSGWKGEFKKSLGAGVIYLQTREETSDDIIFGYEDFLTPPKLLWYSTKNKEPKTIAQQRGFFDSDRFMVEQNFAVSKDGTKIPYYVLRSKDMKFDGTNPTVITGYGGFSLSMNPIYSPATARLWLNHGGTFISANLRGGGEYGPDWHKAAVREKRQNAYDDFNAVTQDIIKRKITSPRYLGIKGGSNAGLLAGVAFTQHPELYRAVVASMPLLDMMRYTRSGAGRSWIDEYGDPDKPEDAAFISKYSPYQNVKEGVSYPDMFLFTSSQDDRAHPSHARKMAAYLESLHQPVLFYEDEVSGHGHGTSVDISNELALEFGFLWMKLGPQQPSSGL